MAGHPADVGVHLLLAQPKVCHLADGAPVSVAQEQVCTLQAPGLSRWLQGRAGSMSWEASRDVQCLQSTEAASYAQAGTMALSLRLTFRSKWTIFLECRYSIPCHTCCVSMAAIRDHSAHIQHALAYSQHICACRASRSSWVSAVRKILRVRSSSACAPRSLQNSLATAQRTKRGVAEALPWRHPWRSARARVAPG